MLSEDLKLLTQCANARSFPLLIAQITMIPAYIVSTSHAGHGSDTTENPYVDLLGLFLVIFLMLGISLRFIVRKRRMEELLASPERIASLRVKHKSVEIRDDRGRQFKLATNLPLQTGPGPAAVVDALMRLAPQAQLLT